jgi:hypothetical protein
MELSCSHLIYYELVFELFYCIFFYEIISILYLLLWNLQVNSIFLGFFSCHIFFVSLFFVVFFLFILFNLLIKPMIWISFFFLNILFLGQFFFLYQPATGHKSSTNYNKKEKEKEQSILKFANYTIFPSYFSQIKLAGQ